MLARADVPVAAEIDWLAQPSGGILALDIGKCCGWAHGREHGTFDMSLRDDHGEMLAVYSDWLEKMLDERRPAILAVEQAGFARHVNALGITTLAMGRIAHMLAWSRGVARREAMAHQVRRWLLGTVPKGHKAVDAAVRDALADRNLFPQDEHAADAMALALYIADREAAQ